MSIPNSPERDALKTVIRLYFGAIPLNLSEISVDQLDGEMVDLRKPTELELAQFYEISMEQLGKLVNRDKDRDLIRYSMWHVVDKFMRDHKIKCSEDVYQQDSIAEAALTLVDDLFQLYSYKDNNRKG